MIVSSASPNQTFAMNGGDALSIVLPTARVIPRDPDQERVAGRVILRGSGPLKLAVDYARLLIAKPPQPAPGLRQAIATHLAHLIGLAINGSTDGERRVSDDVRVSLILGLIDRLCAEVDLDADRVGEHLNLSGRSIQHLLQQSWTTFSDELRDARLRRSEALLRASLSTSVTDIAHASGFADLSTFYRAFRNRYGMRPKDFRLAARERDGCDSRV